MQREIKFRFFDPEIKKFITTKYIHPISDCPQSPCFDIGDLNSNYYKVSQYTGLHDTSGKPIFEGDILRSNKFPGGNYVVKYGIERKVTYGHGESFFELTAGFSISAYGNKEPEEFLIIGNIYQNPELLES